MYDHYMISSRLVMIQSEIRAMVNAWCDNQHSALNAACARKDFEDAVFAAVRGDNSWQVHTNTDLTAALGNCNLKYVVYYWYDR